MTSAVYTWISVGAFVAAWVVLALASDRREREVGQGGAVGRGTAARWLLLSASVFAVVSVTATILRMVVMAF